MEVRLTDIPDELNTKLCDQVCYLLAGQFGGISPDTPVFSTNKTDIIYRTEILLFKVSIMITAQSFFLMFVNCYQTLSLIGWFGLGLWCLQYFYRLYHGGSVLLLEEIGRPGENRRSAASH